MQRITAVATLMALVLPLATVAAAGEQVRHAERAQVAITDEAPPAVTPVTDHGNTDAERDRVRDQDRTRIDERPVDRPTVEPERERDRHRVRDARCSDEVTDARCCPDRVVDTARCRDAEPPEVNIRKLIWRLIFAQEWRKLFQVLHRLGII